MGSLLRAMGYAPVLPAGRRRLCMTTAGSVVLWYSALAMVAYFLVANAVLVIVNGDFAACVGNVLGALGWALYCVGLMLFCATAESVVLRGQVDFRCNGFASTHNVARWLVSRVCRRRPRDSARECV